VTGHKEKIIRRPTDFVYMRFIGDRNIQEKDFGRIQIDRIADMQKWADNVKNVQEDGRAKLAVVAANNHYAGFGPGTVNVFRNMLGSSEGKWQEVKIETEDQQDQGPIHDLKQRTLSDFLGKSSTP
jgi:uncharacterized protein YecE (DUF72 family)